MPVMSENEEILRLAKELLPAALISASILLSHEERQRGKSEPADEAVKLAQRMSCNMARSFLQGRPPVHYAKYTVYDSVRESMD